MKKLVIMCVLAAFAMAAKAQFYAGGSIGLSAVSTKQDRESHTNSTYMVMPEIGYRFNRIFSVGVSGGVSYTVFGAGDDVATYNVSPYVRTTFAHVRCVDFFADATAFYQRDRSGDTRVAVNGWGVALNPGILVNLSDHVQLMGRTSLFQYTKFKEEPFAVKQVGFSIPATLSVGVIYQF